MMDQYWNDDSVRAAFSEKPPSKDLISFLSELDESVKVLDLGCGGGRHSLYMKELGHNVFSCDYHDAMVEETTSKLEKHGFESKVSQADMSKLPYDDNFFDLVVSTGVLHNALSLKHFESAVKEISRVLKPGAKLYFTIFTGEHISEELRACDESEHLYFTSDSIEMLLLPFDVIADLLAKYGLKREKGINSYITDVETGKRHVNTSVYINN